MKSCLLHSNMYQKLLFSTLTCEELGSHFCPYKIDLDKMKTSDFPGSVRDLRPQGTLPPRPEGQTRPLKSRRRGGNAGTGTQTRSQTDGAGAPGAPTLPGPSLQDPRRLPTMRTGESPPASGLERGIMGSAQNLPSPVLVFRGRAFIPLTADRLP